MPNKTFYFRKGDVHTLEKFAKICEREDIAQGQKLMPYIRDTVAKHSDGNPQTILEYAGKPQTLPLYKTCQYSDKTLVQGEFYCKSNNPRLGILEGWRIPLACSRCDQYQQ